MAAFLNRTLGAGVLDAVVMHSYHLRNISTATEILDCLRSTYVFENWHP
jgi:hypothetical protein